MSRSRATDVVRPASLRAAALTAVWLATFGACAPVATPPATPPSTAGTPAAPPARQPATPSEVLAVQRAARPPDPRRMEISEASIRGHLEFLASDALNGRASGSRDEWIAATYVASQFRHWGLEPMGDAGGYVQRIETTPFEVATSPVFRAGDLRFRHGAEMLLQSISTPAAISGPLHRFVRDTPVPAGALVLLPADATPLDRAASAGAAAWLVPETPAVRASWAASAARLPATPPRAVALGPNPSPRPARVVLSQQAWDQVAALPAGGSASLEFETQPAAVPTATWNAIARLTGADPRLTNEVIVLSAHIDHIGARTVPPGQDGINNGADDDASGTVAVMELAKALARGPRPARTLVFALFGSEESGGHGAGYFVDRPVVPLDRIVADLQFEMIGRPDPMVAPQTLWLTGYERSNLGAELARLGARLVADPHPAESFFTRSDNIRFARRGIVAHTVSSYGLHTDYHRPSDEVSGVDVEHMTEAIRSLLEPIRRFADSTFRPQWMPGGCPSPCKLGG